MRSHSNAKCATNSSRKSQTCVITNALIAKMRRDRRQCFPRMARVNRANIQTCLFKLKTLKINSKQFWQHLFVFRIWEIIRVTSAQKPSNTTRCFPLTKLATKKQMHFCFSFTLTKLNQQKFVSSGGSASQRNALLTRCPCCRRLKRPAQKEAPAARESQNALASDHYHRFVVPKPLPNRVERVRIRWNRPTYRHRRTKGQSSCWMSLNHAKASRWVHQSPRRGPHEIDLTVYSGVRDKTYGVSKQAKGGKTWNDGPAPIKPILLQGFRVKRLLFQVF